MALPHCSSEVLGAPGVSSWLASPSAFSVPTASVRAGMGAAEMQGLCTQDTLGDGEPLLGITKVYGWCFACMYIYAPYVCLQWSGGHRIPWNWS